MGQDNKEVCSIRIMFPVTSDDEAIKYKKAITELLVSIPEANIQFGLMTAPSNPRAVSNASV